MYILQHYRYYLQLYIGDCPKAMYIVCNHGFSLIDGLSSLCLLCGLALPSG